MTTNHRKIDLGFLLSQFVTNKVDSKDTQRTYRHALIKFFGWIQEKTGQRPSLAHFTRGNIIAFRDFELARVSEMTGKPISPATVALSLAAISRFDEEIAKHFGTPRVFVDIKIPHVEQKEIISLNRDQYQILKNELARNAKDFFSSRRYAAVALALDTLLRNNELCRLKLGQLDLEDLSLHGVYISKNHPPQKKLITDDSLSALRTYLPRRYQFLKKRFAKAGKNISRLSQKELDQYPLFLSQQGEPGNPKSFEFTTRVMHRVISGAGQSLGLHVYPHILRHTTARQLLESGVPIRDVADHLEHKGLAMVMRYTQPGDSARRRSLEKRRKFLTEHL